MAGSAEIDPRGITVGGLSVEVGTDNGVTPSLAKVRLKITLGGTNPAAFLKIGSVAARRASRAGL